MSFNVISGELLWGQLDTVLEGINSKKLDSDVGEGVICKHKGGTIYQAKHQYRTKAKIGKWCRHVIKEQHIEFVIYCHEDGDPALIRKRCSEVGFSWNPDPNKDVKYINRYDWGYHHLEDYKKFKGDSRGVFLVDKLWGLDLMKKIEAKIKNKECDDSDEEFFEDIDEDNYEEELKETLTLLQEHQVDFEANGNIFSLSHDGNHCGIYDSTFMGELCGDWVYAWLIFDQTRQLEAFVFTNYPS